MLTDNSSLSNYDSALVNKIAYYVCQAIITIQDQQPELLLEKYKNVAWRSDRNQLALRAKLTEVLSQTQDQSALLQVLQRFLKALLIPESIDSPVLVSLLDTIRQLHPVKPELNGSVSCQDVELSEQTIPVAKAEYLNNIGIAILLLDAENLQINVETEKFLTTVCACPLQVKIAFANWRSMGKLDIEFHGRGYELIHVPPGRDNADGKMIAFGSSIHERYPKAKEVLVCSSDHVMTNLCNHLQQNGLTVYRVSKQGENIKVLNTSTGKSINHLLTDSSELPSLEQFINQLKGLIKAEQKQTKNYWVKLAKISQNFINKYQLPISEVVSKHLPGKKIKDIFINYPAEFVIHQIDDKSEIYVTLFEINSNQEVDSVDEVKSGSTTSDSISSINSKAELEQALKSIINTLTIKSPQSYINVGILSSKFIQQYGKSITDQMKCLQISGNFIKFLQSCSSFDIKQTKKGWEVALR